MSPEYAQYGHFSEKLDVFSFGVLLLEIVSGKKNASFYRYENSLTLAQWVSTRIIAHLLEFIKHCISFQHFKICVNRRYGNYGKKIEEWR